MDNEDIFFYDFQDLQAVYEFDRRHARDLKAAGVFRQGIQWTPKEIDYFATTKKIQESVRLEKEGIYADEEAVSKYDPFDHIAEAAPTFRANDERHKAQYKEFMYTMGRMAGFNIRINELKRERMDLLTDRQLYSEVLASLHKESFTFEHTLTELENDLEKTGKMLATYAYMVDLYTKANKILAHAQRERKKCEIRRAGLWDEVKETKEKLNILHDETRDLLKLKFIYDMDIDGLKAILDKSAGVVEDSKRIWIESEMHSDAMLYCKPGGIVMCRFGQCKVIMYRHEDQTLMIELPFCTPKAIGFIQAWEVIRLERAQQHGERLLMSIEDDAMHKFDNAEHSAMLKELYQMRHEEMIARKRWEIEDLQNKEEGIIKARFERMLYGQYLVTKTPNFKLDLKKKVDAIMEAKIKANLEESKKKKLNKKAKVKQYSAWKKHKLRQVIDLEMRKTIILRVR
jgi:hypothetical protein